MTNAPTRDPRLVWIDLETSGLTNTDPGGLYSLVGGAILEVGVTITGPDLEPVASRAHVIHHSKAWISDIRNIVNPAVDDMHAASGLWDECGGPAAVYLDDAEADLVGFLDAHGITPRTVPMCGSSVHTDRQWLAELMPLLEGHFHYRNVDVSSIKELVARWYEGVPQPPAGLRRHRALPDLDDTIAELRHYRDHVFRDPADFAAVTA